MICLNPMKNTDESIREFLNEFGNPLDINHPNFEICSIFDTVLAKSQAVEFGLESNKINSLDLTPDDCSVNIPDPETYISKRIVYCHYHYLGSQENLELTRKLKHLVLQSIEELEDLKKIQPNSKDAIRIGQNLLTHKLTTCDEQIKKAESYLSQAKQQSEKIMKFASNFPQIDIEQNKIEATKLIERYKKNSKTTEITESASTLYEEQDFALKLKSSIIALNNYLEELSTPPDQTIEENINDLKDLLGLLTSFKGNNLKDRFFLDFSQIYKHKIKISKQLENLKIDTRKLDDLFNPLLISFKDQYTNQHDTEFYLQKIEQEALSEIKNDTPQDNHPLTGFLKLLFDEFTKGINLVSTALGLVKSNDNPNLHSPSKNPENSDFRKMQNMQNTK